MTKKTLIGGGKAEKKTQKQRKADQRRKYHQEFKGHKPPIAERKM